MATVLDLSGNRPANALNIDYALGGNKQALHPDFATQQNVSFTASSVQSGDFASTVEVVRIVATQNCYYRVGNALTLTAVTADAYLPAGIVEYIDINPGEKIAAIRDSASGVLSCTPMTKKPV